MGDSVEEFPRYTVLQRVGQSVLGLTKRMMQRNLARINPEKPSETSASEQNYDEYGFSIPDNAFANGIMAYENSFNEKRERRLKRWEEIDLTDAWKTENPMYLKILIRKGIPDHYRARMWYTLSGASEFSQQMQGMYKILLDQPLDPQDANRIELDIYRTFPSNVNYMRDAQGAEKLRNVLRAFAKFAPSTGYCQSFNYLAGVLLLFMDEEMAFLTMVQMLDSRVPGKGMKILDYYNDGMLGLRRDILVLEMILQRRHRRLYNHLKKHVGDLTCICAEWFLCLFSISLPMPTLLRVWDSMFHEGDKILFRVAIALFKVHEKKLLKLEGDLLMYCKTMASGIVQHDEILKVAFYHLTFFRRRDIQQMRLQAVEKIREAEHTNQM